MNESEKQFSLTRAASSTTGVAKSNFLSVIAPDNELGVKNYEPL